MTNHTNIPEPKDSGSDGSQVRGDSTSELVEARPLEGLPMVKTIEGLAASNTRAFGSEVTSALIAGATSQLASELQYTKKEMVELRQKNETLRDDLSRSNTQKAVLEERINSFRSNRHLSNLGIAVGTTLLAISFQLFKIDQPDYGYVSLVVGTLLLLLGWYSSPKGGDK